MSIKKNVLTVLEIARNERNDNRNRQSYKSTSMTIYKFTTNSTRYEIESILNMKREHRALSMN